jgi:hypothetical protein
MADKAPSSRAPLHAPTTTSYGGVGLHPALASEVAELRAQLAAALQSREAAIEENQRLRTQMRLLEAQVMPAAPGVVCAVGKLAVPTCAEFHTTEREAAERLQEENDALAAQLRGATDTVHVLEKQAAAVAQLVKRAEAEQAKALQECREQLARQHKAEILQLQEQMSVQEKKTSSERQQALAEKGSLMAELASLKAEFTDLQEKHHALQLQLQQSPPPAAASGGDQQQQATLEPDRSRKQRVALLSMSVLGGLTSGAGGGGIDHARTPKLRTARIASTTPASSPKGPPKVPPISSQPLLSPNPQ